jgi:Phage integrase family
LTRRWSRLCCRTRDVPSLRPDGWLSANPVTGGPYHQEEIQKTHIRKAGVIAGIGGNIGWHTFRHSYRSWLDETGAPLTVQKELMRHASIQTTMNIYGKAMTDSKRQAHSKVCRDGPKQQQIEGNRWPEQPGCGYWELMGVFWCASNPCNRLRGLVAGVGFEPTTFGL